jgi:hypothetical protein
VRRSLPSAVWPVWCALGALACGGASTKPTPPPACSTASGQSITLNPGEYQSVAALASAGCLEFPGNASASNPIQYLVAAQIATDSQGAIAAFILNGDTIHPVVAAAASAGAGRGLGWGERFHDFLRSAEHARFAGIGPAPRPASQGVVPALRLPPPTVGDTRTFSVCADLSCLSFQTVTATAKTVSGHMALYVDNLAPANGLTQADFDSLGVLFDSRLYAIDTTAYGRESDIDGNTVVAVLMTNVVNRLVTRQQCSDAGFVAGFFFGADIDPIFANDPRVNHGEVFYSIVADPDSILSCRHSVSQLETLVPITFIHEFQHMISYNQHVLLRGGSPQDVWLDEGMSHFAEELGGRSFLPGDQATFSNFTINDLYNAYTYLNSTDTLFLAFSSGIGSLAERGADWLFVRFVVDQAAADTSFASVTAVTRALEQTTQVGGDAIAAATGTPFATFDERWSLANYVSDLPGFTAPPALRYVSWSFRTTYASLSVQRPSVFPKPFPLTPPTFSTGDAVSASGTLRAGSAVYALINQAPQAPGFTLLFSGPKGQALPSVLNPRLNVIRTQ